MIELNNNSTSRQSSPKSHFALIRGPNMTYHQPLGPVLTNTICISIHQSLD